MIQRGLESGSDLTGEFDANPHLAENFELEFNNRKLGQILEILYGLTSREVKTAIAEQRQVGSSARRHPDQVGPHHQAAATGGDCGLEIGAGYALFAVLPQGPSHRYLAALLQLFGEGTTMVLVTLGVMVGLGGIPQGGLISISWSRQP